MAHCMRVELRYKHPTQPSKRKIIPKKQQSEKQVFYAVDTKYWILYQKTPISRTKNIHDIKVVLKL